MPTALKVKFQHEAAELWEGYQASTCAVERRRFQVLALLAEGRTRADVLAITRYSVPSYVDLVHRYNDHGLEGLQDRRHRNSGAPTLLSDAEVLLLAQTLRADYAQGIVWNGAQVGVLQELERKLPLRILRLRNLPSQSIVKGNRPLGCHEASGAHSHLL